MPRSHIPIELARVDDTPIDEPLRWPLLRALRTLLAWCLAVLALALLPPIVARWLIALHLFPL